MSRTPGSGGTLFQNVPLDGSPATPPSVQLAGVDYPYRGTVGLIDGATPLAVFTAGNDAAQFRRYDGSGPLNAAGNWTPAAELGIASYPKLAGGRGGLYLLATAADESVFARKWNGTTFGAPVPVAKGAEAPTLHAFQDASGRLHAVFGRGDAAGLRLVYANSDTGRRGARAACDPEPPGRHRRHPGGDRGRPRRRGRLPGWQPGGRDPRRPSRATTAGGAADRLPPSLSKPKLSRKRFRVGPKPTAHTAARRRRKAPRGTTVSYALSEAATVSAGIDRELKGRRVRRKGRKAKCLRETRRNRKGHKRCTLYKKAGTLTRQGALGKNSFAFSGRIGKKKLAAGSYQLTLTPTDRAGNTGKARPLRFQIVR